MVRSVYCTNAKIEYYWVEDFLPQMSKYGYTSQSSETGALSKSYDKPISPSSPNAGEVTSSQ
jgi:hypothetical protein